MSTEPDDGDQCQECGAHVEFIEHENPPHLTGPAGEFSYECPECGAFQDSF